MIEFILSGLFCDHMVLQQKQANPIWGWDRPGQVVSLQVENERGPIRTLQVTVDERGAWRLLCPELPAGGPYRLRVRGSGSEEVIEDVQVGEVWLAGGQSNMEWTLWNTDGGPAEAASAAYPNIRYFKVPQRTSEAPARDLGGAWRTVTPRSAGAMTAVGYHYARLLGERLKVPVGIISDNWGGTRIEAWVSADGLAHTMDVPAEQARMQAAFAGRTELLPAHLAKVLEWEKANFPADPGNTGEARGWALPRLDDSQWTPLRMPGTWQSQGLEGNGAVWLRRSVDIPERLAGRELRLELGRIDDLDTTYFNGERVGGTGEGVPEAGSLWRSYRIPARLVKAGQATIAVRVFDQAGEGGLVEAAHAMGLFPVEGEGGRVRIDGEWRAMMETRTAPGVVDWSKRPWPQFPQPQEVLGSLYNGMIAPVAGYGLRGVIWYQGESNTGAPEVYGARFRSLIRDWRGRWGQGDFPVYYVQLANFRANEGWPRLREQQEQVLSEAGTGMAVLIDKGDPADIHPRDKRVVGERLARIALKNTYGFSDIEDTGPVRSAVSIAGPLVRVRFAHASGLCTADGRPEVKGFELAGADGVFHPASASLQEGQVLVTSDVVPNPVHVRYAWSDAPETNLCNAAGLPARPFRTDAF